MKQCYCILIFCLVVVTTSCTERKKLSDSDFYGNSFINLSDYEFYAPENWKSYVLGDGEFEIKMPPYMKENSFPQKEGTSHHTYIFNYRDTSELAESHYGRIAIEFLNDESRTFNKATDYISLNEQYDFWGPIVEQALKGGKGADGFEVPDGKLLNGPHCKELRSNSPIIIYDAFYRRGGHIKDEGPVSVHLFYLMNKKEAAMMSISFHDKDSVLFRNLFNVVKTFRWKEIYQ